MKRTFGAAEERFLFRNIYRNDTIQFANETIFRRFCFLCCSCFLGL